MRWLTTAPVDNKTGQYPDRIDSCCVLSPETGLILWFGNAALRVVSES